MRILILLVVLAAPALSQVHIACGKSPESYSKAVFDKRTAKMVHHWSCVVRNESGQDVRLGEADVQGFLLEHGVAALSSKAIRVGAPEIKRRGTWATASRVLQHAGLVTAALAAGEVIQIGPAWGSVAGFTALQLPTMGEMLKGRDPEDGLFEQLAIGEDGFVAPAGRSVAVNVFSAPGEVGNVKGEIPVIEEPALVPSDLVMSPTSATGVRFQDVALARGPGSRALTSTL